MTAQINVLVQAKPEKRIQRRLVCVVPDVTTERSIGYIVVVCGWRLDYVTYVCTGTLTYTVTRISNVTYRMV